MSHQLPLFSKTILEQPQLISPAAFTEIAEYLNNRETMFSPMNTLEKADSKHVINNGVGVMKVEGALTDKPLTGINALCAGTSYRQLLSDMDTLCNSPEVHTIVMEIDSNGGMAAGLISCSRQLREKASKSGKRFISWIDGAACSAAMGLALAAPEVIINPSSQCGSIGVVLQLNNDSRALEKQGIDRCFIYSGENKIPYTSTGAFKQSFLNDLQERVDELYNDFTQHCATMRGLSQQVVINTQAKVYTAKQALGLSLVDKLLEPHEFWKYVNSGKQASSFKSGNGATSKIAASSTDNQKVQLEKVQLEKLHLEKLVKQKLNMTEDEKAAAEKQRVFAQMKRINEGM